MCNDNFTRSPDIDLLGDVTIRLGEPTRNSVVLNGRLQNVGATREYQ